LILDLIAIFELLQSSGRSVCGKLIWILIIIFFPIGGMFLKEFSFIFGFISWFFFFKV
jgi:hypothetical protein